MEILVIWLSLSPACELTLQQIAAIIEESGSSREDIVEIIDTNQMTSETQAQLKVSFLYI